MNPIIDNKQALDLLDQYFDGTLSLDQRSALVDYLEANIETLPADDKVSAEAFLLAERLGDLYPIPAPPADLTDRLTAAIDAHAEQPYQRHKHAARRRRMISISALATSAAASVALIFALRTSNETVGLDNNSNLSLSATMVNQPSSTSIAVSELRRFAIDAATSEDDLDAERGSQIATQALRLLAKNIDRSSKELSAIDRNISKAKSNIRKITDNSDAGQSQNATNI